MMTATPLKPPIPKTARSAENWGRLTGSSLSLAIATLASSANKPCLVITPDTQTAHRLEDEIRFFSTLPIHSLPDWETLPYDSFSPHQDIISGRLKTLAKLPSLSKGIILTSINTLMQRIAPSEYIGATSFSLEIGDAFDPTNVRRRLEKRGYYAVSQVLEHGEFSVRGSIFDLYPMGSDAPCRLDLFDDEIDSIRTFDPETQRSHEKINNIELLPAREFPTDDNAITRFRNGWRDAFAGNPADCPLYQNMSKGVCPAGIEYYLPLFFEKTGSLLDYLPEDSLLIQLSDLPIAANTFWKEIKERHEQRSGDRTRPLLPPQEIFFPPEDVLAAIKRFTRIKTSNTETLLSHQSEPALSFNHKLSEPALPLKNYLNETAHRTLITAESRGRREHLLNLLKASKIHPTSFDSWKDFINDTAQLGIVIAPLEKGFALLEEKITLITEATLLGQHVIQRRRRKKSVKQDSEFIVRNLAELTIGSAVVHIEHGVGRYLGLETITSGDHQAEYLCLEYKGSDKLYIPIANLHLISRYSGADLEHAPMHNLSSKQWEKLKKKASKEIKDVAADLLALYAKRAARKGFGFNLEKTDYEQFANTFAFEETPDQEQAIVAVLSDMQSEKPMDRLICGDVGFGKTEVALRAAFIAVQNNKQVAILVPTTLLAQQHYETFSDRFADWPVNVEVISRFRSAKEQKQIVDSLKTGKVDIVIGTHKLLQSDIKFDQLGLLIIDEEHRFGVQQKERLKSLRAETDLLTLTATPIPRTLNMAMAGVRDLSIIATPPSRRLSIKTFVHERENTLIREAILREILRGGQVYFLHNKVETIAKTTEELRRLVPEARIELAHGQMRERELESLMVDFYHQRFNVLVCTTIIETGIDIPTANTIIMDRADRFGLAQLHQLRGRVGRSHHQAYAYLMVPDKKAISKDAEKRLDAIAHLEDLGVGFTLATHDLEIRGAGEFLGEEQSGQMQAIGFSLYTELLERAVKALQSGEILPDNLEPEQDTEIDVHLASLIPENYLPDVHSRLMLYKRIASCQTQDALDELQVEMIDRFGTLPEPSKTLFSSAYLKLKAKALGIAKLEARQQGGKIEFHADTKVDPSIIIKLIQQPEGLYRLDGPTCLRFTFKQPSKKTRIQDVEHVLEKLTEERSHD